MNYRIIQCSFDKHASDILDIYNEVIETSTAMYDYQKRTMENMRDWFQTKTERDFPVIGLESENGTLMAFGTYGPFRTQPAYKYTIEHSIYIHQNFRGQGLGHILLELLIQSAKDNHYHAMIAGIDADNQGSISLHEKHGFKLVGTMPEVGYKFERWLTLALYQLILVGTPAEPVDG